MCPPYPKRDRKRRLNGAVCRNHRIKRVVPCRCYDGHVKEPYEMSMAWEPDGRSNFFFSPPAHLCAVTYMTEISLIVTLNNQFTFTFPPWGPGGLSRECVLRIPCVSQKATKMGRRYIAQVADTALSTNLTNPNTFTFTSRIGALASPKMGDGTRCPEG